MTNEEFESLHLFPDATVRVKVKLNPIWEQSYEGEIISYDGKRIGFRKKLNAKSDDYDRVVRYFAPEEIKSFEYLEEQ